jgi:hypothetical protein
MALRSEEWWRDRLEKQITSTQHMADMMIVELFGYRRQLRSSTREYDRETMLNALKAFEKYIEKHPRPKRRISRGD